MDIRMPRLDGLEASRRILAAERAARILILTTFALDDYVYEALKAGASGFVLKDDPPEQLIAAVRTVAAHPRVRVIDLTEWDPPLDQTDLSALTAGRWLAEVLSGFGLR